MKPQKGGPWISFQDWAILLLYAQDLEAMVQTCGCKQGRQRCGYDRMTEVQQSIFEQLVPHGGEV
jgi:hypothetical protein